jgi:two-component system sensor histidine kinase BaeS
MPINMQALSFARLILALVIALLAGAWLGRFFTKPLNELSDGATALHSGNLAYRVPIVRDDEFSDVADAMNDMAERVSEQIEQLKDDAKRRRQFLADVAHELRSPVTTMKTMAGALQDGLADDPERKVVAVDALVRTSDRLLRLVVDLMDLAKLDLKELPMNLQEADVREVLIASVTAHQEQARAAGITLDPIESGEPVMAVIDPDRITQVLDNIIDNAIEYAGNGSEVNFHLEDGNPVRLTISDNGKGIPTDAMPYVFDSFYRVDAARTPRDAHAGLGLRIAQSIIEAHGGSLTLTSTEGQGSQVAISLPNEGTGGPAQSSG